MLPGKPFRWVGVGYRKAFFFPVLWPYQAVRPRFDLALLAVYRRFAPFTLPLSLSMNYKRPIPFTARQLFSDLFYPENPSYGLITPKV